MELIVTGGPKYLRKLVKELSFYCAENLINKKRMDDLYVEVHIRKVGKNEWGGPEFFGMFYTDDSENDSKYKKTFYLEANRDMDTYNLLKTLSHEWVHIKQYANGEMVDKEDDVIEFKGVLYTKDDYKKLKYWDEPWEIEAFSLEERLTVKFCKEKNYRKRSWFRNRYLKK